MGMDSETVKGGAGGITVTLAFPVPVLLRFWAEPLTEYVAAAVPTGTDFVMVAEADDEGAIVRRP